MRNEGFTLIELLIVILIIGILSSIAIPVYNGQKARAKDAHAKSALTNALKAARSFYTIGETYTGVDIPAEEGSLLPAGGPGDVLWPPIGAAGVATNDPKRIRVHVPAGGACIFLGNLSQGRFAYYIIDCPNGGSFSYAGTPTTLAPGTYYGDATNHMGSAEYEAINEQDKAWDGD